jgi:3-deoxy-7-phosphoheptulonate synthase
MIITVKEHKNKEMVKDLILNMDAKVNIEEIEERNNLNLGLTGNLDRLDIDKINKDQNVEKIISIKEPFKKTNREYKSENTIIQVGDKTIGGKALAVIAGPCAVESEEQLMTIAKEISTSGSNFLRGGAFKPRTSPYSFQGLRDEGLKLLKKAKEATNMPVVTEIMSPDLVELFMDQVDVFQIGARNMQNFDLLKEVGKTDQPVLLKRGMSSTIKEFLMAAEYIMSQGNENVILCERGIRTFESFTRNTLDLSSVLAIKKLSHLPVIVDPSHATGKWWMVKAMAKAAVVVGADGIMVEVHHDPENAKSDGPQSLLPSKFDELMQELKQVAEISGRTLQKNG